MSGAQNADVSLPDLPFEHERDEAWAALRSHVAPFRCGEGLAVTAFEDVKEVLREPNLFSAKKAFDAIDTGYPLVPLGFDPPEQTRLRRLSQPFFAPRRIRALTDQLRAHAVDLIDPIRARGRCDFVADVAVDFPARALTTLLGLPAADAEGLVRGKDAALALTADATGESPMTEHDRAARMAETGALAEYLGGLVDARLGGAGTDPLSELLAGDGRADRLSRREAMGLCLMLVLAGLETVTGALGLAMERLAAGPARHRLELRDPATVPAAVEELLRLDPPAPYVPRVTSQPVVIAGRAVPAGTVIHAYLGTANRDESVFDGAGTVDIARESNPHLSFGYGAHRCLGTHLARLEMQIILEEWHRRVADYRIAPGCSPAARIVRANIGLDALPLELSGDTSVPAGRAAPPTPDTKARGRS